MAQLRNFEFHEGTTDNPVVLSARQISGLVAVYNDSNVTKDCSGVVKAASGKLRVSEYNAIEALGFTIVETTTVPDEFTLYAANSNTLYEGKSVQLYSTGIDIKSLHLEVVNHEIVISNGLIGEDLIKSRIHISNTGLVTVDEAEENATWQDIITIQAYPTFDPSNKILINNPITVKGIAMGGISVTAANAVLIGGKVNVEVKTMPADNTKNNYRIEVNASRGAVGNNVYTAPTFPVEDTIIAECFLFGGTVPTYHVEKSISVKQPTIIAEIKDKEGEAVEGAYLSVMDGATQVVTQLNNGESMTAVLGRTYSIEAFVPQGYTKAVVVDTVTPTEVETVISAVYYPLQVGVMAVYEDGSYIELEEFLALGLPRMNGNSPIIGAGYIGSDGEKYVYCGNVKAVPWNTASPGLSLPSTVPNPNTVDGCLAVTIEQAAFLTNIICNSLVNNGGNVDNVAAIYCQSLEKNIANTKRTGILSSMRQIVNLSANEDKINQILPICGIAQLKFSGGNWFSCNKQNAINVWGVNGLGTKTSFEENNQWGTALPLFQF